MRGLFTAIAFTLGIVPVTVFSQQDTRPDILFIAIDDLNDWVGVLGGHPQAKTPNIDALAARGMLFTNAHTAAPLCNPSRVSLLTGIEPSKSGVYGNGERFRQKLPKAVTLMQYFRIHGYIVKGGGKIFHDANRPGDLASWDFYFKAPPTKSKYKRPPNLPASAWAPCSAARARLSPRPGWRTLCNASV